MSCVHGYVEKKLSNQRFLFNFVWFGNFFVISFLYNCFQVNNKKPTNKILVIYLVDRKYNKGAYGKDKNRDLLRIHHFTECISLQIIESAFIYTQSCVLDVVCI